MWYRFGVVARILTHRGGFVFGCCCVLRMLEHVVVRGTECSGWLHDRGCVCQSDYAEHTATRGALRAHGSSRLGATKKQRKGLAM